MINMNAANDNIRPATIGGGYCPELGETHDGTALVVYSIGHGGYYVKWEAAKHAEVLAAFKRLRIRPRYMETFTTTKGAEKWSAELTFNAGRKLDAIGVYESKLD